MEEEYTLEELINQNGLNKSVVDEWTEGAKIIKVFNNPNNLCLLVEFKNNEKDKNPLYQYQRFFVMSGNTACSIDKEFHKTDLDNIQNAAAILVATEANQKNNWK